jgi:D-3-phosphoglycerate dehydrogenase / 2-oxoglutarate reductase
MMKPMSMLALDNVIVTPHVAAGTAECLRRMGWDLAGNILDILAGRVDRDAVVNVEVLRDSRERAGINERGAYCG